MAVEEYAALLSRVMRRLYERGLIDSKGGNASIRVRLGSAELILITPSGVWKPEVKPEDISVVSIDGLVVYGRPSSEYLLHLEVYRSTDATAIVHAHNSLATALAEETLLEAALPESIDTCITMVPHLPSGSRELALETARRMASTGCRIAVIEGHGVVAAAAGEPKAALIKALDLVEAVEIAAARVLARITAAGDALQRMLRPF